jgi:N-hydroxyarylamine O-acetyltransferase
MSDESFDFAAYARRIGFDGAAAPTLDTLARLIDRHAAAIPFENIDVLAGRVPRLDLASLQQKLVQRRRGGYCFEQNGLFLAALRHLGFAVGAREARVRTGVPADVVTGRTHMALRVALGGAAYLADVGFGGLAPCRPLRWVPNEVQGDPFGAYRIQEIDGDFLLQCETHDGWTDCYRIAPSVPQPVDLELANWFVATHPNAFLRQNLLVARSTARGSLTLFNRTLSLRSSARTRAEETTLHGRAEFADVLADRFGLEIDAADLDALLAVVERRAGA